MRTRLLLTGLCFLFTTWSLPLQADAAKRRRCLKAFSQRGSARHKTSQKAKRAARKKAYKAAKRRCPKGFHLHRVSKQWTQRCMKRREKGMIRCHARALFRCCSKRTRRTKHRPSKRHHAKKRLQRCSKRIVISRSNHIRTRHRASAQKQARQRVRARARQRCGRRTFVFVSKWTYRCQRRAGKYKRRWRCLAQIALRCCSKQLKPRRRRKNRKKRPTKRPTKRPHRRTNTQKSL